MSIQTIHTCLEALSGNELPMFIFKNKDKFDTCPESENYCYKLNLLPLDTSCILKLAYDLIYFVNPHCGGRGLNPLLIAEKGNDSQFSDGLK
jgi:hypothetical protein